MSHHKLAEPRESFDTKVVTPAYDKAPDPKTNDPKKVGGHGQGGKGH